MQIKTAKLESRNGYGVVSILMEWSRSRKGSKKFK